jgi:hypothetical protein
MDTDRVLLSIAVCLLTCTQTLAQAPFVIRGHVSDSSGAPLPKATVKVHNKTDSTQTLTGNSGAFHVSWQTGAFTLTVTMKGFTSYVHPFDIPDNIPDTLIPIIVLQPVYQELAPVIIGTAAQVTRRGDTLQYHAAAFHLREGSFLADLIPRLPGITINPDSGLMVMGKKVKKLLLDGRSFYGGDVMKALNNLPYDIIDKVEIIDDYGDEARLTGVRPRNPEKVLNITLKKEKTNGLTGILQGGGGNAGQYIGTMTGNFFKGPRKLSVVVTASNNSSYGNDYIKGLDFDYADKWMANSSTSVSGNILKENRYFSNNILQDNYYISGNIHQEQNNSTLTNGSTQHASYEWLYSNPAGQTLKLSGLVSRQVSDQKDQSTLSSFQKDSGFTKQTLSDMLNHSNTTELRSETKVYYSQAVPHSRHRFSLDASVNYKQIVGRVGYQTLSRIITDSVQSDSRGLFHMNNSMKALDINGAFRYYLPLGKKGFIETHYLLHSTRQENHRSWQQPDNLPDGWRQIDSLSNDFIFSSTEHALYGGYTRHNDKWELTLGWSAAPGKLSGTSNGKTNNIIYHYFNWLPDAAITYNISSTSKTALTWTAAVSPPALIQLLPVTDISNPQYPITGNPHLKPSVRQSAGWQYDNIQVKGSRYKGFGIGLNYSFTRDPIISNLVHPHDTGTVIQHTYFENAEGDDELRINWHFELPLTSTSRLKAAAWGYAGWIKTIGMTDSLPFNIRALSYDQYISLQYNHPDLMQFAWTTGYTRSFTKYTSGSGIAFSSGVLDMRIDHTVYLARDWVIGYIWLFQWNNLNGSRLRTGPLYLHASLERSFLKHKQLSCRLAGINLLNVRSTFDQSSTAGSIVQHHTSLLGRTFLLSMKWTFEKFRQKK